MGKPERMNDAVALARQLRADPTECEIVLWEHLRNRKLDGYKFRRQAPIGVFIVDFLCSELKLIVEVDGLIHEQQRAYDAERDRYLEACGYKTIRFVNDEIKGNVNDVLGRILKTLTPLPPSPGYERGGGRGSPHP